MDEGARRYDIDWLRVIAMLGIFLLHTMHLFDEGTDWHLRNADTSTLVLVLRGLIDIWAVPTFFVISGVGAWFALKRRSGRRFLAERIQRLLVPLYSVGLFAIVVPQIYFDAFTNGYRGSFGGAIARSLGSVGFDPSWPGLATFFPGHLWFLQFLFLVSVVVIPALLLLRSERGKRAIARISGWCSHRGGIFLFIVPITGVRVALMGVIRGQFTWATFVFFAVLFIIGYMLAADERFTASIRRNRWIALAAGIVSFAAQGFLILTQGYQMFHEPFSGIFVVYEVIVSIGVWGFIVFLMGVAANHLDRPSKILSYANEAVLPFYLFHQTVILGIGWFVIRWNMGVWPKLIIVTVTSFAATLLLYDVLVRHSNVMRFFFGMRPRRTLDPVR
ncbi:MAG: acyltransferase family protein [Candidatus Bipolaricaulota bacterium]|nr:MAG: acyltransferase family protein [Candidatus Bipolaricaulota bacterium]